MRKKIINFFDHHRLILVCCILIFVASLFIGINSFFFFHHKFTAFTCTSELDDTYCFHEYNQILKNPEESKNTFFKEKASEIKALQKKYKLKEFNFYTTYYYEVASLLNYNETGEGEELYTFFKNYNRSYDIPNFYKKYVIYFDLFYHYKVA